MYGDSVLVVAWDWREQGLDVNRNKGFGMGGGGDGTVLKLDSGDGCTVLSRFSSVRFFAALWTIAHQRLCPWDSPGKNTGVHCHALL